MAEEKNIKEQAPETVGAAEEAKAAEAMKAEGEAAQDVKERKKSRKEEKKDEQLAKQVEELTGMSRQNIRYYERMGLLEPDRDDSNAYRDYSEEDVRRLKLIRMLRMLDMPLKDIQDIINEKVSLREAVRHQKEILQTQQKQLNAAIEVCASIGREKDDRPDVGDDGEKRRALRPVCGRL